MKIALLVITDGRSDYLARTLTSAQELLPDVFDDRIVIDDTAHELGFAGAIQAGWDQIGDADYIFHLEGDFVFNQPVPVEQMVRLLEKRPQLAQVVLKRQPWNHDERRAGGIVEQHPADFWECFDGDITWTEHRRFFSTNPCVYPAAIARLGWPQESESEGKFTHRLLRDPLIRFAFYGGKFDPPMVEHIGAERAGHGY